MKQGKTITELAAELTRINETAKDFIVPTSKMRMNDNAEIEFQNGSTHNFTLNNWSAGQLASFADIPKQYFDRIKTENPALIAKNVNHAFERIANTEEKNSRMLRTLDGNIRGFLSSRYRRLDSYDLLSETLPVLLDNKFKVESSEITEKRLYIKTSTDKIQGEVNVGDVVQYGVVLSTSDVGAGALRVEPFLNRLACLNGMIMQSTIRKSHLGRNVTDDEVSELLSDKTKALDDAAFYAKVRDVLTGTMRPEIFQKEIEKLKDASQRKITNFDLEEVVELAMNQVKIVGKETKQNIIAALASGNEGAGLTQWGLANSFTRAAQAKEIDYDTATELEKAGGAIIELDSKQWRRIAEAV